MMSKQYFMKSLAIVILSMLLGTSTFTYAKESVSMKVNAMYIVKGEESSDDEDSVTNVDKSDPYAMIRIVADITFKRFARERDTIKKNPNILKDIVREELIPYVNYQYAAFKVIGSNFKQTNKEDRAAFVPVFRDYLVTSYAQVFTLYKNQEVRFAPAKDFSKEKVVAVNTMVIESGREPIDISFRVRKSSKTNQWKAYDMVAEGISLLDSKQAELSSLIRQKGLPYVTELLKEKAESNIVFK